MKTIVYRSFGSKVEYSPYPAQFDAEFERLSNDPNIDDIWIEESE